jgi:hypothetical protein
MASEPSSFIRDFAFTQKYISGAGVIHLPHLYFFPAPYLEGQGSLGRGGKLSLDGLGNNALN